jgi:cytochrome c peroxidase
MIAGALVALVAYRAGLDSLAVSLRALAETVATAPATDSAGVRSAFRRARVQYKHVELLVEYLDPVGAEALNGPDADAGEGDEADEGAAVGALQDAERALYRFPVLYAPVRARVLADVGGARTTVDRLRASAPVSLRGARVVEACRLEVIRVMALGLAGDDSRAAREGIPEAIAALEGVRENGGRVDAAIQLLEGARSFDELDRLPVILALGGFGPMPVGKWSRAAAVGRRLFSDPALSGGGARSCATCHVPSRGFTDGLARAVPLQAGVELRHTPSLLNVKFADAFFDDGRVATLEAQVVDVVRNPTEMGGKRPARWVASAIAAYERTLVGFDSRFDRALRGDTAALTASERRGFTVFMGKGRCGTCHYLPYMNGLRPPGYRHSDFEVLGIDADSGRGKVTGDPADLGAMKTPGLRFLPGGGGGPYMHNGVYRTMAQVIAFYDSGGVRVANQTLSAAPLHLSGEEKRALEDFLGALATGGAGR